MLNIYFGEMPEETIYDTSMYFRNSYKNQWITSELSKAMIKDIDKSDVVSSGLIESPVLGAISPERLSGGVKALILIAYDKEHIFNASNCCDNCAKWLLKIAENRKVVINLHHIMDFGKNEFRIRVLNTGKIVNSMLELLLEAGELV